VAYYNGAQRFPENLLQMYNIMNMFVKISYVLLIFRPFCFLFKLHKPNADEADRNIKTLIFYLFLFYVFPAINSSVLDPDLRIRIRIKHFKRVRNRFRRRILIRFRIRFRIQVLMTKNWRRKKYSWKKFIPRPSLKDVQAPGEAFSLQKRHPAL
jgi:hypothetical protein